MYFKTTIFLLTCLVCAESARTKKDVKDYNMAKEKLNVPNERGLNESEMAEYAEISVLTLRDIANSISIKDLDNINVETFKLLTNAISKRKSDYYYLKEPQIEVGSDPSHWPTSAEDSVLEAAYFTCKTKFNVSNKRGVNENEMSEFMEIDLLELRKIANSIAIKNLDNINLEKFKVLGKAILTKINVSITEPQGEPKEAGPSNRPTLDEDGVLKAAYYACKMHLDIPNERGLNESEMAKFMEVDVLELRKIANSISIQNLESINLDMFKLLAIAISKKRDVLIREPQGDRGVDSTNDCIIDEDGVLEMAYNIAKIDHGVSSERGLNVSQMANYARISVPELEEIANLISIENLDNINSKDFVLLAKRISEIKGVPIMDSMEN